MKTNAAEKGAKILNNLEKSIDLALAMDQVVDHTAVNIIGQGTDPL